MPEPLKHAILGVGGVGGLVGACLARSGETVTFVMRPESVVNYPEQIKVESTFGNFSVPAVRSSKVPPVDVLWITVKATQLDAALPAITQPESVRAMVPLLNGIDHLDFLRARYGEQRVIAATIAVETERVAPGHIVHRSPFARLNVSAKGKELLAGAMDKLQKIGFETRFIDDEATLMWGKSVFLAPLALTSTAGDLTIGEILSDPKWRHLLETCVREVAAVGAAEGAKLDAEAVLAGIRKMPGNMRSSMQKDVAQGKLPELEAIAGPILRGAERHGIGVPVTKKLVETVRRKAGIPEARRA